MKGKLIKKENHYYFWSSDWNPEKNEGFVANSEGTVERKLSLKNCEAIENGYDLDELASERLSTRFDENSGYHKFVFVEAYKEGFQKALEILGDKKFSEDDVKLAIEYGIQSVLQAVPGVTSTQSVLDNYTQSLQQTEWDVEICCYLGNGDKESDSFKDTFVTNTGIPKLDANSCVILKRI